MMRLIALASVALSGTWCAHGALTAMGNYEIRPAGDGSSSPFAKVLTVDPFVFETYFESVSSVPGVATFELFANAADGKPCSTGTAISNSTFNVSTSNGPAYNKTGSNSKIFAAQYSIPDVTTTPAYANGTVDLCARTGVKMDIDSATKGLEYVSYVDTLLELNVDLVAKFSNFSQTVNITSTAMGNLTENVTKSVAVEAGLCTMDNFAPSSYKIGQDFSICVSISEANYTIMKFTNVTCENSAYSRQLVVNSKPDTLTKLKFNPKEGYHNTTGGDVSGEFGVMQSVVAAGYFAAGETSFSCSGEVGLYYKGQGRRLLESVGFSGQFGASNHPRNLQELEKDTFSATVGLSDDGLDTLSAPAMILRSGVATSIVFGTGLLSLFLAAM